MINDDLIDMGFEWDEFSQGYSINGGRFYFSFSDPGELYVREGSNYHGLPFIIKHRWQLRNLIELLTGEVF